ncbi:hypothetical protein GF340_03180, partial [Candidatus Peregrinibacteria bacterium]|nr:hypothetical protein [Candidatus Peregrinibacteria bacterium]
MVIWNTLRVGFFLAIRSLKRSNRYVTVLIIIILTLIFLNLVAIGGLLLGLIRGSEIGWIKTYGGAVVIEPPAGEKFIEDPNDIIDFTKTVPGYVSYSPRLDEGGKLETGYKEKKVGSEVSNISAVITGIDPELEGKTVAYPSFLYSGRFLENGDRDKIVLGSLAAGKGATIGFGEALEDVYVGDTILATYGNGVQREYELVGIIESKEPEINLKAFVTLDELQDVMNYTSPRYTDIHV